MLPIHQLPIITEASELLGLTDEQMKGRQAFDPDWKFIGENNESLAIEDYPVNKTISSKEPIHNMVLGVVRSKNSDVVWLMVSGFPVLDKQDNIIEVIISFIDITERNLYAKELQRSERELKRAQEITHIGSWYLDLQTNEVIWSEELYKMYGFNPTLPVPPYTEHQKLFTPESWKILSSSLENTSKTGVPYELELITVKKDGSNGWMWVRGETIADVNGKTVGLWGAAQDITEHK